MAEPVSAETAFERLDPEQVSSQSFATARKGFDQKQVQAYLVTVSNQIKAGQQAIRDLKKQVHQGGDPAHSPTEPEAEFSSEGVKLLVSDVEASRRQTQTEAGKMESEARRLAEQLRATAEELRSHPEISGVRKLANLLAQASEQAQAVEGLLVDARAQVDAEVEEGRAQGREIVEKAKALRLTVLRDMARRRQTARVQVERLRAGRDKLMSILGEARESIDGSMESAKLSLGEAKVHADAAARRVEDEKEPTDTALLSELDDAEDVGMIADPVAGPVTDPVISIAEHPAVASAEDPRDVDAIFARLRTQGDNSPATDPDGEKSPASAPDGAGNPLATG